MSKNRKSSKKRHKSPSHHRAAVRSDNSWTSLKEIYEQSKNILNGVDPLDPFIQDEKLMAALPDRQQTERQIQTIVRDVRHYASTLEEIYKKHAHRTGSCTDPDDMILAFGFHEEYIQWTNSFNMTVMPVLAELMATMMQTCETFEKDESDAT